MGPSFLNWNFLRDLLPDSFFYIELRMSAVSAHDSIISCSHKESSVHHAADASWNTNKPVFHPFSHDKHITICLTNLSKHTSKFTHLIHLRTSISWRPSLLIGLHPTLPGRPQKTCDLGFAAPLRSNYARIILRQDLQIDLLPCDDQDSGW